MEYIVDGNGTADANGSVDSDTPGIYHITYSATDTAGNVAVQVVRTIRVLDHDAPTIALLGDTNVTHEAGPEYVDVLRDNDSVDGNGSADANGTVNYLVPGIYQTTYTYTDTVNPAVPVIRTIKVEDNTPPVITLIGDTNITHPHPPLTLIRSEVERYCGWQWYCGCQWFGDSNTPGIYHITYSATIPAMWPYKLKEPSG